MEWDDTPITPPILTDNNGTFLFGNKTTSPHPSDQVKVRL